ncbi:MAG TPA: 1,4-alpha-glucan branching protein domain-containing protein [Solirubrobacterales bacterium]
MPARRSGAHLGDLAIVLHSHMPYVEGFGTWPFGEEWLFDAVARSYIPVLEAARDLTVTVSPVLADQLEAPGVAERLAAFVRRYRLGAAELDAAGASPDLRSAAEAEAARYRRVLDRLDALDGDLLAAFRGAAAERGLALVPSAATHAVLPLVATDPARRLQIDAGLRSHRRRFGAVQGFWLPECAYRADLEPLLAERGLEFFCVDQSAFEGELEALAPVRSSAGPVAFTLDWDAVQLVWSERGYPSDPAYAEFHRQSLEGSRLWAVGGGAYDVEAATARADQHAREFAEAIAARLSAFREGRGEPGLVTFAVDTELLGHWWAEGPTWLEAVAGHVAALGIRLVTLPQALERHRAERRTLHDSTWGEGKDFRTWDSPEVADLAWGPRRLELRLLRELDGGGLAPTAAERAARELLAVQASDWAFLDRRRQAGEYPYQRATAHAQAFLDALHAVEPPEARLRNLAPDLSLAPLLAP